ncbi:MAG: transporter substrate-binding protein [Proteobacteria bacterium]|nr:transporter substrate-binding protein [Pseudomonadota bacterium]
MTAILRSLLTLWAARTGLVQACLLVLSLLALPASAHAIDILRLARAESADDRRLDYTDALLFEAMRRTTRKFGPYQIQRAPEFLSRERLLDETLRGEVVNVTAVPSQPAWEEKLYTIWIPVDLGVADYRISLIRKDQQARLSAVKTLDDLKTLSMGIGTLWSSRKIYEDNGFDVTVGADYEALFRMLLAGRFVHFPRGVNEVFTEFKDRQASFPDLAIDRALVVQFPFPRYFFVTPKASRLAQRVEAGLESMVRDGTMMKMMLKYHADMIRQANFCTRRLFRIPNPLLSPKTPLDRKEFWFNPYDPKTGICPKTATLPRQPSTR